MILFGLVISVFKIAGLLFKSGCEVKLVGTDQYFILSEIEENRKKLESTAGGMDKHYFMTVLFVIFVWVAGALRAYTNTLLIVSLR